MSLVVLSSPMFDSIHSIQGEGAPAAPYNMSHSSLYANIHDHSVVCAAPRLSSDEASAEARLPAIRFPMGKVHLLPALLPALLLRHSFTDCVPIFFVLLFATRSSTDI